MGFFEKFNKIEPSKKGMKEDNQFTDLAIKDQDSFLIQKEESLDDMVPKLNKSLNLKEVISGKDPMDQDEKDEEAISNILSLKNEDRLIHENNIELLMLEIDHNKEKIKQLEVSILKTEEEESVDDQTKTISLKSLQKMKDSLDKLNTEKEIQIKEEADKIGNLSSKDFYNLN